MFKKTIFVTALIAVAMCLCAVPAQAQFGKSLKKIGKSVQDVASSTVGEMASDMAADQVSTKIVDFMDNNNNLLPDDNAYTKRLQKLVEKKYTSVDGINLNYKVYQSDEINILACANGSIRVYTGMMDALNDDELLAVIAIQIGHIANKDARDALMKVASEDNASKAGSAQLEKMLSFSGDKLGSLVNELIQIPYNDEQNKKADAYAYDLLKKNGSKVSGLASSLEKLGAMEDNDKAAETDDTITPSGAAKYTSVHSNNSARASLISTR